VLSTTVAVSERASSRLSSKMGIVNVFEVSPSAKVSVPVVGAKSEPAVAVLSTTVKSTESEPVTFRQIRAVEFYDRRAGEARLRRSVYDYRSGNNRQHSQGLDGLRPATDAEVYIVRAGIGVSIKNGLPQRACSTVICIRNSECGYGS